MFPCAVLVSFPVSGGADVCSLRSAGVRPYVRASITLYPKGEGTQGTCPAFPHHHMATKRRATAPAFCTVIFRARDPRQPRTRAARGNSRALPSMVSGQVTGSRAPLLHEAGWRRCPGYMAAGRRAVQSGRGWIYPLRARDMGISGRCPAGRSGTGRAACMTNR